MLVGSPSRRRPRFSALLPTLLTLSARSGAGQEPFLHFNVSRTVYNEFCEDRIGPDYVAPREDECRTIAESRGLAFVRTLHARQQNASGCYEIPLVNGGRFMQYSYPVRHAAGCPSLQVTWSSTESSSTLQSTLGPNSS